tara:strand:- start:86 stop:238 length:153 start_codon:yes stop_codon:yes gene_type:complete
MFKKLIEKIFGKRCKCDSIVPKPDYSTMSKGDLKKLLDKGEIKSIYKPYN